MTKRTTEPALRFLDEVCGSAERVLCAVSGGLDSMCLLHLVSRWGAERGIKVTAAHFNHRLRGGESDRDEAFVRDWCAGQNIPFVCGRGDVAAFAAEAGQTVEEAARTLRYEFLERQACDFILTAHHADDNAETMLLNLIRGTGAKGLCGIPQQRGRIARPFLHLTREDLAAYAAENGIPFVEDATNEEDIFARNALRHKVLPVLRELNPNAVENMSRTAALLAQDDDALEAMAAGLAEENRLPLNAFGQPKAVVSRAVRQLLADVGGHRKDLTAAHIDAVCRLAEQDEGKILSLPYGLMAVRERDAIVIRKAAPLPEEVPVSVGETVDFGAWSVTVDTAGTYPLKSGENLTVTCWRSDDRMTLAGSRGARSLKRLCAERGISPAERDRLPVLRVGGKCAAVPGVGVDTESAPQKDEAAAFVTFHYKNAEENAYEK